MSNSSTQDLCLFGRRFVGFLEWTFGDGAGGISSFGVNTFDCCHYLPLEEVQKLEISLCQDSLCLSKTSKQGTVLCKDARGKTFLDIYNHL